MNSEPLRAGSVNGSLVVTAAKLHSNGSGVRVSFRCRLCGATGEVTGHQFGAKKSCMGCRMTWRKPFTGRAGKTGAPIRCPRGCGGLAWPGPSKRPHDCGETQRPRGFSALALAAEFA